MYIVRRINLNNTAQTSTNVQSFSQNGYSSFDKWNSFYNEGNVANVASCKAIIASC